jgi:hypothetical protein
LTLGLLLAVSVGLIAAFCNPFAPTEVETLRAMDEADVIYPGAVELGYDERPGRWTESGILSTYLVWSFGIQASAEEIEQWYALELGARGWSPANTHHADRTGYDRLVRAWERDGRFARLAILKTDGVFAAPQELRDAYETLIDVRLFYK